MVDLVGSVNPDDTSKHPKYYLTMERARRIFLKHVSEIAPRILQELAERPLGEFNNSSLAVPRTPDGHPLGGLERYTAIVRRPNWLDSLEYSAKGFEPEISELKAAIFAWSEKNHLDTNWCRAYAYQTVCEWSDSPGQSVGRRWAINPSFAKMIPDHLQTFNFSIDLGYPENSDRYADVRRIRGEFEKQLTKFFDQVDEVIGEYRIDIPKLKRAVEHIKWLAEYQVMQLLDRQLAERHTISEKAIISGLAEARRILSDPSEPNSKFRRRPAGRPRKPQSTA